MENEKRFALEKYNFI